MVSATTRAAYQENSSKRAMSVSLLQLMTAMRYLDRNPFLPRVLKNCRYLLFSVCQS
jgi:hypothetical protein